MPIANRSTSVRAKPTGLGQRSGDGVYDRGSNVAGPRADGGEQQSLLAERRELGNNLGERKVESAWPGKATGRDTVNATISMRTGFLVGTKARAIHRSRSRQPRDRRLRSNRRNGSPALHGARESSSRGL